MLLLQCALLPVIVYRARHSLDATSTSPVIGTHVVGGKTRVVLQGIVGWHAMLICNMRSLAVQNEQDMTECSQLKERKGDSCDWPYQVGLLQH